MADVLVLPVFEGPEPGPGVRDVKGVDLMALYADAKLRGKPGQSLLVPNAGALGVAVKAVMLVGIGKKASVGPDALRRSIGKVAPQLAKRTSVATTFPQAASRSAEEAVQATVEGLLLGAYRFDRYRSAKSGGTPDPPALKQVRLLGSTRRNTPA